MIIGAYRCMATAASGHQCKRAAVLDYDGWRSCAEPLHVEQGTDTDHVAAALDHLVEAMQHVEWSRVPRPIQHLIEWSYVDILRARGEVGP